MHLIKFLLFGAVLAGVFGEFGHFPFGGTVVGAVYLSDIFLLSMLVFWAIWIVSTGSKVFFPPIFKWLGVFLGVGVLSLIFSLTVLPWTEVLKGSLYLVRLGLYSSALLTAYNLVRSEVLSRESLVNLFIMAGAALAILGFGQLILLPNFNSPLVFLSDFGFDPHQGRLASTFLDPNFVGTYLTLTSGLIIYRLKELGGKLNWFLLGMVVLAVILTLSRSAYLGLGALTVGVVFSFGRSLPWRKKAFLGLAVLILAAALALFYPRVYERLWGGLTIDTSAGQRFESWEKGLEVFQTSPLLGVGFNNLRPAFARLNSLKVYSLDGGHAGAGVDSSLLMVLATTGALGGLAYLMFWGKAVQFLRKRKGDFGRIFLFSLIGLFLSSQFINALFFPPIMLMVFSLLGVLADD